MPLPRLPLSSFPLGLLLLAAPALVAQPVQFEVASIRPGERAAGNQAVNIGVRIDGQQVSISSFSLRDYIGMAYEIAPDRIQGPDSLDSRFALQATLPAGAAPDKLGEMLQALLADRFELKFHRDMPEAPVYAMSRGKGTLLLKESAPVEPNQTGRYEGGGTGSAQGVSVNLGNGSSYQFMNGKWEGKGLTPVQFADQIAVYLDRPVLDQTGLTGRFDVAIQVAPEDAQIMMLHAARRSGYALPPQLLQRLDASSFGSLEAAFEKVGLKLEPKRLPLTRIVVDSVRAAPTEN